MNSNEDVMDFLARFNMEHAEDEIQQPKRTLTEPPEFQPCEFGFECNNCGACH